MGSVALLRTLSAALVALAVAAHAVSAELPPGWRYPAATDYFDAEVPREFANPLVAELSDDSALDSAFLLVEAASGKGGVFVRIGGSARLTKVNRTATDIADYVLSAVPPGRYDTLAGEVHFPHGAVLLREVEYGSGSAFWLEQGTWRDVEVTQGDLRQVE